MFPDLSHCLIVEASKTCCKVVRPLLRIRDCHKKTRPRGGGGTSANRVDHHKRGSFLAQLPVNLLRTQQLGKTIFGELLFHWGNNICWIHKRNFYGSMFNANLNKKF